LREELAYPLGSAFGHPPAGYLSLPPKAKGEDPPYGAEGIKAYGGGSVAELQDVLNEIDRRPKEQPHSASHDERALPIPIRQALACGHQRRYKAPPQEARFHLALDEPAIERRAC